MADRKYFQEGKVSGFFLVVTTVVVCIFVGVMWNIVQDKSNTWAIERAEDLQVQRSTKPKTKTQGDIKAKTNTISADELAKHHANNAYSLLISSIRAQDNLSTQGAIDQLLQLQGLKTRSNNVLKISITENNEFALDALLKAGADCKTSSEELARKAIYAQSDELLTLLLQADCGLNENPEKLKALSYIMNSKNIERVFAYDKDDDIVALYPRLLEKSITGHKPKLAMKLLNAGVSPNTLNKDGSKTVLELSIDRDEPSIALKLINLGAKTFVEIDNQVPRYVLSRAVKNNQMEVALAILKQDPGQIKKASLSNRLFEDIRRDDNLFNKEWIELIIRNGGNIKFTTHSDLVILRKAIAKEDVALTEYLLSEGVDPNTLILKNTLLGEARLIEGAAGEKMVTLLEKYGALDDVLSQSRKARGIDKNAVCTLGKQISIPTFDHFRNQIVTNAKTAKKPPKQDQLCQKGILYCMQQGGGSDNCMYSMPTCDATRSTEITLCCDTKTKDKYFLGRCAGLTVQETFYWQNAL